VTKPLVSLRALLLVVVTIFSCTACTRPSAKREGRAERIVSISPSTTETLFVLGAGGRLVGRSRYCDWPKQVETLPQIGGYVDPSYEAILALRPDLVVGARGPSGTALTDRLDQRGIATYFPPTESFAQIDAMILGMGERTGTSEVARSYVTAMHEKIRAVEREAGARPRVRVLLVFGLEPLSVAGPSSFPAEMLSKVGAINVVTEGGAYPTLGIERVLALDPDVVINAAMGEQRSAERMGKDAPGWSRVRAIAEGRLVSIDDDSILRPGPRIAEGLATLARAVHAGKR
jgi:iron complex transport system substrate-binding protein